MTRAIEYAIVAILRTDAIEVRATWPSHRALAADTVDGLVPLVEAGLGDRARFRRMALPVLRWSQGQDPECRHFAMIYDSVPESKDAYKEGLEAVETYFYIRKMN